MKGIVLAGGSGSRLYPTTTGVSKQLLPVYDKPAIYYPISILMLAGIRDILIISTERDLAAMQGLLGDGARFGVNFEYRVQAEPRGIADAFLVGESFIGGEPVALILGDNLFYGHELTQVLTAAAGLKSGAQIFAYRVKNPQAYGIVEFDAAGRVLSIEEKPQQPKTHWAVTGLYFYDSKVCELAKTLKPSRRGELEITDLNRKYMEMGELKLKTFGRGVAWFDTGTPESLLSSSFFVQTVEERQGWKIACLEEIALIKGFISAPHLAGLIEKMPNCSYRNYLAGLMEPQAGV